MPEHDWTTEGFRRSAAQFAADRGMGGTAVIAGQNAQAVDAKTLVGRARAQLERVLLEFADAGDDQVIERVRTAHDLLELALREAM